MRVDQQPWCDPQVYYEGNHRMQPSWLQNRYNWLDAGGMPTAIPENELEQVLCTQEAQTSVLDESAQRELSIWRELLDNGQLTAEELDKMKAEPQFSFMVQEFSRFESAAEEYKQLVKTPKELRRELGIDENLTSQKRKDSTAKKSRDIRNSAKR